MLDLYAGSGALGLEAASRGATHVTLVDKHPGAITAMGTNVASIKPALPHQPTISVVKNSALKFLATATAHPCDLVFLDPPYDASSEDVDAVLGALMPWLAPHAWVMLERSARSSPPQWPQGLAALDTKNYGETVLYFAEKS